MLIFQCHRQFLGQKIIAAGDLFFGETGHRSIFSPKIAQGLPHKVARAAVFSLSAKNLRGAVAPTPLVRLRVARDKKNYGEVIYRLQSYSTSAQ